MSNLRSAKRRMTRYRPKAGLKKPSGMAALEWEEPAEIKPQNFTITSNSSIEAAAKWLTSTPDPKSTYGGPMPHAHDECLECGVGYYLPSGHCDHCNMKRRVTVADYIQDLNSKFVWGPSADTARVYEMQDGKKHRVCLSSYGGTKSNSIDFPDHEQTCKFLKEKVESEYAITYHKFTLKGTTAPAKPSTPLKYVHVDFDRRSGVVTIKSSESHLDGIKPISRDLDSILKNHVYGKGFDRRTCSGFAFPDIPNGLVSVSSRVMDQYKVNTIPEPEPNTIHHSILRQIRMGMVECEICHETLTKEDEIALVENESVVHSCCKDLKECFLDKP